ncbi:alpha/beta hydrolase [Taibaiella soli]|uniref:Alpha/beta hydrolase n=1 Tax=Taibaiella soli TaxID=1649169 RepID=A0A2W2ADC4_9BACT|nr:alpha/beta hydrolase-fold protein [Taibaiella soli]PZF73445.1 alpha/beta hydrolase [Taibaiella soli]
MRKLFLLLLIGIMTGSLAKAQTEDANAKPFVLGVVNQFESTQLSETRTINVYLPDEYKTEPERKFPVIYLLDGSANEDFIHIAGLVQFLTMIQAMPPTIVVGVANVDRKRDFTFPTQNKEDLKNVPTSGGSAKFMLFVEKDLQPYVNGHYRTNGERTIIGQSLGGLMATEILLKKPALFDNYIIVSPSLWWNDESLLKDAPQLLKKATSKAKKVYIAVGEEGDQMKNDAKNLSELLLKENPKTKTISLVNFPKENHLTILHNAAYNGLSFVFGK